MFYAPTACGGFWLSMSLNNGVHGLNEFLSETAGNTILFVGIGNILRKDDGVGVYISNNIPETTRIKKLTVEVSVENYIGKINSLHPDNLVLIDCTDMQQSPGFFRMLRLEDVHDLTFNTHNISLKRLGEFFSMSVSLLAIQPQQTVFGESLTPPVKEAADIIINAIRCSV
jgi:hydrogenase 3 maturation protease